MDLFKRETIAPTSELPEVFVCITDPDGDTLPEPDWCHVKQFATFSDLVNPVEAAVTIIACPDNQDMANKVRLIVENGVTCGVSIVHVTNVTPYMASAAFETSFWQARKVDFNEWREQADEAARIAELARRSELGRDEKRMEANARADGTFKKVEVHAPVEDEAEVDAPVF